jgi:hypothetical protein
VQVCAHLALGAEGRQEESLQGQILRGMRGDEARIVDAFCAWLEGEGWAIEREVDRVDVLAERNGERIYAEAKGRTTAPGLDIDTLYGQLLRRMPPEEVGSARFAVVVPAGAVHLAQRVPSRVRQVLQISIYGVDENGKVEPAD